MDDIQKIIGECLNAAAFGPFFENDSEYSTIFGMERNELAEIARAWPNVDPTREDVFLATNNSFNNLTGYPIGSPERYWARYISVSREELGVIFRQWKSTRNLSI